MRNIPCTSVQRIRCYCVLVIHILPSGCPVGPSPAHCEWRIPSVWSLCGVGRDEQTAETGGAAAVWQTAAQRGALCPHCETPSPLTHPAAAATPHTHAPLDLHAPLPHTLTRQHNVSHTVHHTHLENITNQHRTAAHPACPSRSHTHSLHFCPPSHSSSRPPSSSPFLAAYPL